MLRPHLATFSIVAFDPETKLIAVGGTSCWFAYGSLVPFIEAEVGAVATQAECNMDYGPNGLSLLRDSITPGEVIQTLTEKDAHNNIRQVLVVNSVGEVKAYTGEKCVDFARHYEGDHFGVAGNMLANETVVTAVADFYTNSKFPFTQRVIKALQAGQEAGGDQRGKQSAALCVAESVLSGNYWRGLVHDLRVDDNPDPLKELERLYHVALAFQEMGHGDTAYYENKEINSAMAHYEQAMKLAPDNPQPAFWYAKLLLDMGRKTEAEQILNNLNPRWLEYLRRVQAVG